MSETKGASWKDSALGLVIALVVVGGIGPVVMEAQVEAIDKARFQECRDHFNSTDFQNTTVDGEFGCIKDGEQFKPEIVLRGQTSNPLDTIFAPLQLVVESIFEFYTSGSWLELIFKNFLTLIGVFWIFERTRGPQNEL